MRSKNKSVEEQNNKDLIIIEERNYAATREKSTVCMGNIISKILL